MSRETHYNLGLTSGLMLGAAAMYILDPDRGRRRRALARDKAFHFAKSLGDYADKTARDLVHRSEGLMFETWSSVRHEEVADPVLEERVRARLGRVVSHPSSIEVSALDGIVTLNGPVLEAEVDNLIHAVASVRGVRNIDNRLEVHKTRGDVPGLQGGSGRPGERWELMQANWAPATRFLVGLTGGWLALTGLRRGGFTGTPLALFGLGLLGRAGTNLETERMLGVGGGRRGIHLQKTLNIQAPIEEVFAFISNPENFPRFMEHLQEVKRNDGQFKWTVSGPAGVPVTWLSEITQRQENKLLAWRSLPGSIVRNAGIIRFDPNADGSTRLHLQMSYNPPGGAIGHAVASLFGSDPKRLMDDDLARLKSLLEIGKTRAHGERVRREEITPERTAS